MNATLTGGPYDKTVIRGAPDGAAMLVLIDDRHLRAWQAADRARVALHAMTPVCVYLPAWPGIYAYAGRPTPATGPGITGG